MLASELAFKAADYIAGHGHVKNRIRDEKGRVCINGALDSVLGDRDTGPSVIWQMLAEEGAAVLAESGTGQEFPDDDPCLKLVTWNNSAGVTGEDVISLLRETGTRLASAGR